jgi:hypothetical protein
MFSMMSSQANKFFHSFEIFLNKSKKSLVERNYEIQRILHRIAKFSLLLSTFTYSIYIFSHYDDSTQLHHLKQKKKI